MLRRAAAPRPVPGGRLVPEHASRPPWKLVPKIARMVGPVLVVAVLAGCTGAPAQGLELKVAGAFGARPTVDFPKGKPAPGLQVDELTTGKGARLEPDDVAIVQYTAHVWDGGRNRLVDSSFTRGAPAAFPVGGLLPGLDRALEGRTVGSRVIAAVPPGDGFGPNPPRGVSPSDELFYVVDILGAHHKGASVEGRAGTLAGVRVSAGARPALQVPAGAPPARFASTVLERGSGLKARPGRLVVTQYAGAVWDSRRVFDTTWTSGLPKAFKLGDGGLVKAWERALTGVPAGSRVLMVVPPAYGYGAPGFPAYGIKGSDTLVFVVDVLAVY